MTEEDRKLEIALANAKFMECYNEALDEMCGQIEQAGPGGFFAKVKAARHAREMAIAFANQSEQPCDQTSASQS